METMDVVQYVRLSEPQNHKTRVEAPSEILFHDPAGCVVCVA